MDELRLKRATLLVPTAKTHALTALTSISEKYPDVWSAVEGDLVSYWDFLNTVARVGAAFVMIPADWPRDDQDEVCNRIQEGLEGWNQNGASALDNFLDHHEMFTEKGLSPTDAVGHWVWRNLAEHPSANAETKAAVKSLQWVRPTGALIYIFSRWWTAERKTA